MLKLLIALSPVALVLLSSEILWRKGIIKDEKARKFIHILAGIWIAFWPYYLPFDGIFVLGLVALTLLIYSRVTRLFHAIYAVKRKTYGDILYAVGIIACAYLGQVDWVFTISILYLALADGGAALAGKSWGRANEYKVFGNKTLKKSVVGTLVFFLLAVASTLIGYIAGGSEVISENLLLSFIVLPLLATVIENLSPYGVDNLVTPMLVTVVFNLMI